MKALAYLKARLDERSTWCGIVGAVTGGSTLAQPFNWLAIAAGTIAALVPTSRGQP